MIPKSIYEKDFGDGNIGYATHDDIPRLLELDKGSVYIPKDAGLVFVPVVRKTKLDLITVDSPKEAFDKYLHDAPTARQKRLEFIKEQRSKYNYQDLGIHPLACIGDEGMGYEFDNGWVEFPQIGGVVIGKDVRIGAFSSIKRGTIHDTIIGNGCKIGSHCNVGHNVKLGKDCLLTHRVSIGGSVEVGDNCFFGQGCIIKNKVTIGHNVTIGQGANVLKDVPDGLTVIGIWK